MQQNEMKLEFDSLSCNESFARVTVAAFMTQLDPTLEEIADVKTAVSEAVTNAIIHGYEGRVEKITIRCRLEGQDLYVEVRDEGKGIADVALAMEPLYTTREECDRAGMGFSFMEAFMDSLEVESAPGRGTCVRMRKRISRQSRGGTGAGRDERAEAGAGKEYEIGAAAGRDERAEAEAGKEAGVGAAAGRDERADAGAGKEAGVGAAVGREVLAGTGASKNVTERS